MAHEITETDNVVLHREKAWHGLGIVVENAPTPKEALVIAGLDWEVEQWPVYATDGADRLILDRHQANVRKDTKTDLGVVGTGYKPVQNRELAEFCESIAKDGDVVRVESAGSIRGGAKVWFLLKGESFSVRGKDEVKPYICVSNGHDGGTAVHATPTTVRVVCSNTLHMVIPENNAKTERVRMNRQGISFTHVGDVREKVQQVRDALGLYQHSIAETRKVIDVLAARDVNSETVKRFFLEAYARAINPIPMEPVNDQELRRKEKALDAFTRFETRFEHEKVIAGTTMWNAVNAFTGWLQHDKGKAERRNFEWSRLMGTDADRGVIALETAFNLAN